MLTDMTITINSHPFLGAPQETTSSSNREVTSLDTLQSAQQPAQQGWSYYGSQGYGETSQHFFLSALLITDLLIR